MRLLKKTENLMLDIAQDGGFTYHPDKSVPDAGYVIGVENLETCNGIKPLSDDMFRYAIEKCKEKGFYLGGWFDSETDKTFYDLVMIVDDKDKALMHAKRHDEKAIFDLKNKEEVFV